jgi:pyruvate dehydrogenase E2 component (dihydrolipoamide acetyltransferase)
MESNSFSKRFTRLKNPTSWRKISIAAWKAPNNPTVYGTFTLDVTAALDYLKHANEKSPDTKITINHLVTKALALTLQKFPDMNGIIRWGRIYLRNSVDLFLQVAVREEGVETTPDLSGVKIEACDQKSIQEIAKELKDKSEKIRSKQDPQFRRNFQMARWLPPFLLRGVLKLFSFLIYDLELPFPRLGILPDPFGSAMITSVGTLNLPSAFVPLFPTGRTSLLICVGAVTERAWVVEGKVLPRPILDLAITFDHRFADGVTAARMMKFFKEVMENPKQIL